MSLKKKFNLNKKICVNKKYMNIKKCKEKRNKILNVKSKIL